MALEKHRVAERVSSDGDLLQQLASPLYVVPKVTNSENYRVKNCITDSYPIPELKKFLYHHFSMTPEDTL